jgi:uncharacterized membrane protein YqjE
MTITPCDLYVIANALRETIWHLEQVVNNSDWEKSLRETRKEVDELMEELEDRE